MLGTLLHHAVGFQTQDVGVVKEAMHLHLVQGSLAVLLVVAQDAFQGVEAPVPQPLHQVHIAEAPAKSRVWCGLAVPLLRCPCWGPVPSLNCEHPEEAGRRQQVPAPLSMGTPQACMFPPPWGQLPGTQSIPPLQEQPHWPNHPHSHGSKHPLLGMTDPCHPA